MPRVVLHGQESTETLTHSMATAQCITATLHYTRPAALASSGGPHVSGNATPNGLVPVDVTITDARTVHPAPRLFECGFEVISAPSRLRTANFFSTNAKVDIETRYFEDVSNSVRRVTGASHVTPFHYAIRRADPPIGNSDVTSGVNAHASRERSSSRDVNNAVEKPAPIVHCDYSVRTALKLFEVLSVDARFRKGRFAVINAWRNIDDACPILTDHLAVCDARTVVAPDDFIPITRVDALGASHDSYQLDATHSPLHAWFYYPAMCSSELLLFVQYDSNARAPARYTFHSSFSDRSCPPEYAQMHPRQSIECRCVAFFPDYTPNTIFLMHAMGDEIVSAAVSAIMLAIGYPDRWPEIARVWMRKTLYDSDGVANVVRELVIGGAKRAQHGLDRATADQLQKTIAMLLDPSTGFEAKAKANFAQINTIEWIGKMASAAFGKR